MVKKLLVLTLSLITMFTCSLSLTACGGSDTHTCSFTQKVKTEAYRINSATCTEKAKYFYSCECGKIGEDTFEDGEPLGHVFNNYVSNNDATCEQNGTKTATCSRNCGVVDTITDEGSALEHNYGAFVSNGDGTHSKVCANDGKHVVTEDCRGGVATETQKATCEVCNTQYGAIVGHTHTYSEQKTTNKFLASPATCKEKARYYYSCDCGEKGTETFEFGNTIPHEYTSVVTAPTCEEKGYTTYTCTCGDTYTANQVDALEHKYGDFISNGNGTHTKTCSNDASHKITENCKGGIATETQKPICSVCNAQYGEVLGHTHDYTEVVTAPTCATKGYTTYTCRCNDSYVSNYVDVDATAHKYGEWLFSENYGHYQVCTYNETHKNIVGTIIGDRVLYSYDDKAFDLRSLKLALSEKDIQISSLTEIEGYIVNGESVDTLELNVIITGTGKSRAVDTAQSVTIKVKGKTVVLNNVYAYTKIIDEAEDLKYFTLDCSNENNEVDGYFIVSKDIDAKDLQLSNHVFASGQIYPGTTATLDVGFKGVFDGQGYTIDNLTVKSTGLFGDTCAPVIKNIAFTNASLTGHYPTLFSQTMPKVNGVETVISNVFISIKSLAKGGASRIGILNNQSANNNISVSNVVIDYLNVSSEVETQNANGNPFYMFLSSGADLSSATSMFKNCYAISTAPVLSHKTMPGFAENQVQFTLSGGKVTAVSKVLDEQVNTVLGYGNLTLSKAHVMVGLRAYDTYQDMANDTSNKDRLKEFNTSYWIVKDGVPYWKSSYYKEQTHTYDQKAVREDALKTPASCSSVAIYYKSCKCGAVSKNETFESGVILDHSYDQEVVKEEAFVSENVGYSVYYKSCKCGRISTTETFNVKTLVGKNIMIFGDSYSSYIGTIPEGQRVYYNGTNILNSPDQMWWSLLTQARGGTVVRNDASSGSTINTAGYQPFINRLNKLYTDGFFEQNRIDYVFILGGTNDNTSDASLQGQEKYSNWTSDDLKQRLPAICYFYCRVREILPDAEIYGIANLRMEQPLINAIKNVTEYVGGHYVGIKPELESGHPTILGMQQIRDEILKVFDR